MDNKLKNSAIEQPGENVIAGIAGAFLFALAGGVLWFVFYLMGFLAGISGLVGVICAIKGYTIFAKKESTKGIVISTIIAMLVLAIAWYFCFAYDIYDAHKLWFEQGEIDFTISYFQAVRATPFYLLDPEIGPAYLGDLAIGLLLGIVGTGSYVYGKIKNNKQKAAASVPTAPVVNESAEESSAAPVSEVSEAEEAPAPEANEPQETPAPEANEPQEAPTEKTEEEVFH